MFPPDPGTGPDWAYGFLGIRATMTIELEGHSSCLPATQIQNVGKEQFAGVKALAAFIRQHGGEPSAQVGIFARGNGSTALYLVVILVVFASLVAMRSWFNWFSTSRRDYHPESAIIGMSRDAAPSCLA